MFNYLNNYIVTLILIGFGLGAVDYYDEILNKQTMEVKRINEKHEMRFFFPEEMRYFLERNNFNTLQVGAFDDLDKKPDENAWNIWFVAQLKKDEEKFIPVCVPALMGNERKYILDAIDTNWISSSGPYIEKFESAFSNYIGVKHGIATTSGTTALHLALSALEIGNGDEVIIPNFTMIASAKAVCYTGAMPVFVDAEKETWNMDPAKIEEKISDKTKAIMVVHIYGHPCDMHAIMGIARKYNLKVIEDAAEVHGAEHNEKKCGSFGDIACFSFFGNKILTTGEGGMIITNDDELAKKCKYYKNLCFPLTNTRNFVHEDIGFNYRMSNLHAALGLAQVEKANNYVEMRIRNHKLYEKYLLDIPGIMIQPERLGNKNVYWMNGLVINVDEFGMSRDELIGKLKERGIDSRVFFSGMHRQPALQKYGADCSDEYPVSVWLEKNGFYLPSSSNLKEEEIKFICDVIRGLQDEKTKKSE